MGTNLRRACRQVRSSRRDGHGLGNQAKKLEEDLRSIKTAMATVAAGWEGEAHQAYVEQQELWDKEAADIQQALQGIGKVVGQAGGDYMGGDKKAASYFA